MKPISEETTDLILASAKKEFLEYGFLDASLRRISSECNVSTHTIYTRFGDKEGLFEALVKETADTLFKIYSDSVNRAYSPDYHAAFTESNQGSNACLDYVYQHLDEMKLILRKSHGSKYEHYLDKFIVMEEKYYQDFINQILKLGKPINPFFIHDLSKSSFDSYYEIIDNNLTYDEASDYLDVKVRFTLGGLKEILGIK